MLRSKELSVIIVDISSASSIPLLFIIPNWFSFISSIILSNCFCTLCWMQILNTFPKWGIKLGPLQLVHSLLSPALGTITMVTLKKSWRKSWKRSWQKSWKQSWKKSWKQSGEKSWKQSWKKSWKRSWEMRKFDVGNIEVSTV